MFTTHPIQYQAPWFRAIAETGRYELRVVFSYVPDPADQAIGFGGAFEWDIPLRAGYPSAVLESWRFPSFVPTWSRRPVSGIGPLLDRIAPDVGLVLGWQEVSLVQAMLACRRRGIPVLLRGESVPRSDRRGWIRLAQRHVLRRASGVLAIGCRNREFYLELGVPAERIVDAPYCVDNARFGEAASRFRPGRDAIRTELGISSGAFCVAFVGKLEPKKRPLDFIEAVARARAASAVLEGLIVGDGPLRAACERRIAEWGAPVRIVGFRNQSELPRHYVAADALVLPSDHRETWGLVVNEAMACGLPALVSDQVGCAPDLVIPGETGDHYRCADVEALAERLVDWAANPSGVREMGVKAARHVDDRYSIARACEGLDLAVARFGRDRVRPERHGPRR